MKFFILCLFILLSSCSPTKTEMNTTNQERAESIEQAIESLCPNVKQKEAIALSIKKWSNHFSLDPMLVVAVMMIESRFTVQVKSRTGDYGLMQVNWRTHSSRARRHGYTLNDMNRIDPNVHMGCLVLKLCFEQGQFMARALKLYNGRWSYSVKVRRVYKKIKGKGF